MGEEGGRRRKKVKGEGERRRVKGSRREEEGLKGRRFEGEGAGRRLKGKRTRNRWRVGEQKAGQTDREVQ